MSGKDNTSLKKKERKKEEKERIHIKKDVGDLAQRPKN